MTDVQDWLSNRRETFFEVADAWGYVDAYDWLMRDAETTGQPWPPAQRDGPEVKHTCKPGVIGSAFACPACGLHNDGSQRED